MTIKLCSDLAKANVKAKIVFDVCRLFFDHFSLFFDLFRFRLVLTGPVRGSYCLVNFYCYRPQRSCGKVMFSQASVILSMGEGCLADIPPGQTPDTHPWVNTPSGKIPLGRHASPAQCMLGYTPPCPVHAGIHPPTATAADGTHPTGMHSCWCIVTHQEIQALF